MKIVIGLLVVVFFVFELISMISTIKKVKQNKALSKKSETAKADEENIKKGV